eukprot:scaffold27052_cov20-Prasinocladus_malaysianus.AAC.1
MITSPWYESVLLQVRAEELSTIQLKYNLYEYSGLLHAALQMINVRVQCTIREKAVPKKGLINLAARKVFHHRKA